ARVWDLDDLGASIDLREHLREVVSVSWSPDGRRLATSSDDLSAMIWDLERPYDPIVLGTPLPRLQGAPLPPDHRGHRGTVNHVRWSPDGLRVVTASKDATARVWRSDGAGEPIILAGHSGWVVDALWSPDGKRVLTVSHDKTARVFQADGTG